MHYLRLSPFDVSTQVGRTEERHRQILLTTLSSGGSKLLSAVISFTLIPLTLNYLGTERFGLWMTISSVVAMLSFADLGIGSGLMNAVATAQGKDDIQEIKKKIAAGLLLLSGIALLIIALFFLIEPLVHWGGVLNINSELASKEAVPTIAVVVFWFAISLPAGVAIKVLMGLQKGFAANLWLAAASAAGLGCVLGVIHFEGGLPSLAAASIAPPVVAGIIAGLYLFIKQSPHLRPQFSFLSVNDVKYLAGTSGLFFVLQLSGLIAFQSDNLIIAHYLGPESVAVYAVAFKLFTIPSIILSLFLNALWPAYAEASSRGDKEWIYKSFMRSLKLSAVIAVPISVVTLICGPWIIDQWVGDEINPTWDLLIGLFFWSLLTILGGNFAALMNGLGVIKFQTIASVAMAAVNIMLSIWLVQIIGVSGVIWGSVLSLALILYLPSALYLRKYFR
ncbi:MAG: oligosaccharide flippase family protein [Gammaproteobacteria bacterium]|nr:oligosaccharide flippase family protein [Gammaproteobacteria bacterium]MBU1406937.1 oligosaccharide flippase family protein [Gammaproteobacteria bacterium]MBU1533080.1 oligosaccharide flippase family protein [Gammaproteobacteria bacterium]